jgi:hypothetical protein
MEEGKIAAAWAQFDATERSPSMYIRMRVLPWVTLFFVSVGLGSISAPFGEPASRFTSAIERSGNMEEGKIATAWAQFGATERSPSMYIRACVAGNTFVSVGLGSISAPFGEPASRFTSAIERSEYGRR